MTSFKKNFSSLNKKTFLIYAVIIFFVALGLFSNYGLLKRLSLNTQYNALKSSIEQSKSDIDSLKQRIVLLKSDTLEIERIAREKYGLIKSGEKVYFIEPNDSFK